MVNDNSGNFTDWRISLWGEAKDASKAKLHPMPTDQDDDDHDREDGNVATTSVVVPSSTSLPTTPSDHPHRPVNEKPSSTTTTPTAEADNTTPTPSSTFFLPSIFPTFGVSPRTQIWIYGAIGTILVFALGLGGFFIVQKRRRAPKYESLEMSEGLDASKPLGGGRQRRAGELYDAFAGESDEELFSGDEGSGDEGYRDVVEKQKRSGSSERS